MGNDAREVILLDNNWDYNKLYWVQLTQVLSYRSNKLKNILDVFKTPQKFLEAGVDKWKKCDFLTSRNIKNLKDFDLRKAQKILNQCEKLGHEIITFDDERYPERLRNIPNPPAVLYVWGNLPNIDENVCISVVGTRTATTYGMDTAFKFGYNLAEAGAVVISGGALGIDCTAQKGALSAGGKVICVLGCGIANRYLMKNSGLREEISRNGAVISEYPPYHRAARWTFPMRNRIISGLSLGTLVVEAGINSGALITANLALEQNRDVFAVPGDINRNSAKGTNKLLQICAKPAMNANDILDEYVDLYSGIKLNNVIKNKIEVNTYNEEKEKSLPENLSDTAKKVYEKLTENPIHIDDITSVLELKTEEILQAITELELNSLIEALPGKRYKILND